MKLWAVLSLILSFNAMSETSTCFGTTSNGWLENGVQLPESGVNFVGYSAIAHLAGRTFVHSTVKDIMISAYKTLETEQPGKVFKYAETGFKNGGQFKPHKTHKNGLSVDFMTPVLDQKGRSVQLPTHPFNKFGYNIEFDKNGYYNGLKIDYEGMAAHIVQLHKEARNRGFNIWRVIFDQKLQPPLFKTKYAGYLRDNISFSRKRSWVRHDEHYHVDFSIPCEK